MTGNGKHTTYWNGDDWGMVDDCFTHITSYLSEKKTIWLFNIAMENHHF